MFRGLRFVQRHLEYSWRSKDRVVLSPLIFFTVHKRNTRGKVHSMGLSSFIKACKRLQITRSFLVKKKVHWMEIYIFTKNHTFIMDIRH